MDFSTDIPPVAAGAFLANFGQLACGFFLAHSMKDRVSCFDYWAIVWLVFDALIHATFELPFVYISLNEGGVNNSSSPLAALWREYAKADLRWGVADPTVVSLEILTVSIVLILNVGLIMAICQDAPYRHFLQIALCVSELYGGWMTFCPEWLTGSPSLVTDNPLFLWVYLVFYNGLWVVIPLILLAQSWDAAVSGHTPSGRPRALRNGKGKSSPSKSVQQSSPQPARHRYGLRSKKSD